jgi:GSH-dependent disulfide-bond oxidoreductase
MTASLDLYTWHTPNGRKPAILLAELGIPCVTHLVDIDKGEQREPEYLAINPNGKIPALIDHDPILGRVIVFESGAILQYLAEKYQRFLPPLIGARRAEVLSWLFWQAGGPGPIFGQLGQFTKQAPKDPHAIAHFLDESRRLIDVLNRRLIDRDFVAAEQYSIADIALYPWLDTVREHFPSLLFGAEEVIGWLDRVGARPAVKLGMKLQHFDRAA